MLFLHLGVHSIDVISVADVSEPHAASFFGIEFVRFGGKLSSHPFPVCLLDQTQ
jgi:hypothetical protein